MKIGSKMIFPMKWKFRGKSRWKSLAGNGKFGGIYEVAQVLYGVSLCLCMRKASCVD